MRVRSICLVNPPYTAGESLYLTQQLGLINVATYARNEHGLDVAVVDLALELQEGRISQPGLLDAAAARLAQVECDDYGFSVQCFNLPIAVLIAKRLKQIAPAREIYFGGHEAILVADAGAKSRPYINWTSPPWFPAGSMLKWYFPDRSIGPALERYTAVSRQTAALVEVARGCPFQCSFCSIPAAYGSRRSYKPRKLITLEIRELVSLGFENIHFVDDTLTINRARLDELLQAIRDAGHDISWTGMTRVDLVDSEMLVQLARAGCYSLLYGVESVSEGQRRLLNKGGRGYPELLEFLQWHLAAGIQPTLYFLVGTPNESPSALDETLRVAARLSVADPGCCHFQLPRVVPGTPLHAQLRGRMELDLSSRYAATLLQTVQGEIEEVVAEIQALPDVYSTYYGGREPAHDGPARGIARHGDALFRHWPFTVAGLLECGLLSDLLVNLAGTQDSLNLRAQLQAILRRYPPALGEIFALENWLADADSETLLSRIDYEKLQRSIFSHGAVMECFGDDQTVYRKRLDVPVAAT